LKRLATAVATLAIMFAGATAPAVADEAATAKAAAKAASVCGHSDTLYVNSAYQKDALTCRWTSGLGTLNNYASTDGVARGDLYHHVSFTNHSGRDIHLGFYRQGIRNGKRYTYNWRYNAPIPRGETRTYSSEYGSLYYTNIRGLVKHHATGRAIYTPWINLELCTGPGGDC